MDKSEKKLQIQMEKQDKAIANSLREFLSRFDCAFYSLDEPVKELEKYFDLSSDWDGIVYIYIKTKEGDFSMGYTEDIDLADLQTVINYLKRRADVYLRQLDNA